MSAIRGAIPQNRGNLSSIDLTQRTNTGPQVDSTPSSSSDSWQPRDADLTALAALSSAGLAARTAGSTWALRTLALSAEFADLADLANPAGVAGDPTFDLVPQAANRICAGPASGSPAKPTFRALAAADIPDLSAVYQPLDADLTAIAALSTTAYGRALLTLADEAALTAQFSIGTFTPAITFATPGDLSVAYTGQTGSYLRIGKSITFAVQISFTATYTTATGNFRVTGLPVAASATAPNARLLAAWVTGTTPTWPAGSTYLTGSSQQSQTYFQVLGYGSGIAAQNFTQANVVSGSAYTLVVSGTYYID